MYCQQCGEKVAGNYCANCGAPIAKPLSADWADEINYSVLIQHPKIRDVIRQNAAGATKRVSAEEFMSLADKLLPGQVPLSVMAKIGVPIFTKLGLKTGKQRSEMIPAPPGKVVVAALCSMASNDYALRAVKQLENGCFFEATIPSDLWSWKGVLYLVIAKGEGGTYVDAATEIKGQMFDWGKSNRCLDRLFGDLKELLQALENMAQRSDTHNL